MLVRIAASLDQASKHIIAQAIVSEAHDRKLDLAVPADVVETPGEGSPATWRAAGIVGGIISYHQDLRRSRRIRSTEPTCPAPSSLRWRSTAARRRIVLADTIRSGTAALLENLSAWESSASCSRRVTGGMSPAHHRGTCRSVPCASDLTPDQKVMVVLSERKNGR
jgi:cation transport ATPase